MFILKKKIPGWHIDWETSKLSLKVKLFQVLLRRHLPALLETEINRSKFTKKGKISGQHRQMKRAIKFFFFTSLKIGGLVRRGRPSFPWDVRLSSSWRRILSDNSSSCVVEEVLLPVAISEETVINYFNWKKSPPFRLAFC